MAAGVACRRGGPAVPVEHLDSSGSAFWEAGGQTRSGFELAAGGEISRTVPPGPARDLHLALLWPEGNEGPPVGRLEIALSRPTAGRALFRRRIRVASLVAGPGHWAAEAIPLPAAPRGARLTLRFEAPAGSPGRLILAVPALSRPGPRTPRVVVLFDVDTLRRGNLSIYGCSRRTSPNIDRYFRGGLVVPRCFSDTEWTLPSHATMFTSVDVGRHGVGGRNSSLPAGLPVLAEVAAQGGYRTLAVTSGGYVDPSFGFARGFDSYDTEGVPVSEEVRRALELVDRHRGEPIFLFLHTYQVHNYEPTERSARELFGSAAPLGPDWQKNMSLLFHRPEPRAERIAWLQNRYDAAVRAVDDAFGELLEGLRRRDWIDAFGIVLTADHGEEIFDRPGLGVGHTHPFLYDEYLSVPFLARVPWIRRLSPPIPGNASLLDLAPTLLDAMGLPRPGSFEGRSLLSGRTAAAPSDRVLFAEAPRYDVLAVRRGSRKLIRRPGHELRSWEDSTSFGRLPTEQCFDLESDPAETRSLPCGEAPWGRDLRREAVGYIRREFPGSLVVRFPGQPAGKPRRTYGLRVRGREQPPKVLSFGLEPGQKLSVAGDRVEGAIEVGSSPVWLAFRPPRRGGALDVRLYGMSGATEPRGRGAGPAPEIVGWSDLLPSDPSWPVPGSDETALSTTRPGSLPSAPSRARLSGALVHRLRSLGYLSAGGANKAPAAAPADAAGAGEPPIDLPDGRIRIALRPEIPGSMSAGAPTVVRALLRLVPDRARVGEVFQRQPDGTAAIAVEGAGFSARDRIYWGAVALETTFGGPRLLTAVVPRALLGRAGDVTVSVRDPSRGSGPRLRATFHLLPPD
jgi:arylsulfatase A-like enzyme